MHVVAAKGLTKCYGALCAVDGIDFGISRGECFGFLGPNGAGKTTVMGVIYCFMPPTSGEVKVFGIDVTEDPSRIKSRIGVMPQDDSLDPDLTVWENLIIFARFFDIVRAQSALLADDRIVFRSEEPAGLEALWRRFAVRGTASPKLWMDGYLAAFALAGGYRMVTTDTAFRQFAGLDLELLGARG